MAKQANWEIPVQKNKIYTGQVVDFTHQALGIVKVNHYPIFIEGAIKGEEVQFKVIKTGKKYAYGKLIDVIAASPDRVEIKDKVYSQTGTMNLQHLSYPAQLQFKKDQVSNVVHKIAKLPTSLVNDTIGMENPYEYRNKAQVPVGDDGNGLYTGFFRKNSHEIIPLENFMIQDPVIDQTIVIVREILEKFGLRGYDEENHRGDIRHIMVRKGRYTGEVMVVLVSRTKNLRHKEAITREILEKVPKLVSVVRNINPERTNVILGKDFEVLYGEDYYTDRVFDHTFKISHQSFFQVNSKQMEVLYQTALDYANLNGEEVVVDAYSGIGTIALSLAEKAKKVYGIEVVPSAVRNAQENAQLNKLDNVEFMLGKAEEWMVDQVKDGLVIDVLVVDPPRKGLATSFVQSTLNASPTKIIYVSCNPSTLARDLKDFVGGGYQVQAIQPVDMFPQTYHIETVVLLTK